MDVLVKWNDGTVNCVDTDELKTVKNNAKFQVGTRVKMLYISKWYYGTIITTEESDSSGISSSDDNAPLSKLAHQKEKRNSPIGASSNDDTDSLSKIPQKAAGVTNTVVATDVTTCTIGDKEVPQNVTGRCSDGTAKLCQSQTDQGETSDPEILSSDFNGNYCIQTVTNSDDLDGDDPYSHIEVSDQEDPTYFQTCEFRRCKKEVFSSCFRCSILLCWNHFVEELPTCDTHRISDVESEDSTTNSRKKRHCKKRNIGNENRKPEDFEVEGAPREYEKDTIIKINKKKVTETLRRSGAEYVSVNTKKSVKGRALGPMCNSEWCKNGGSLRAQFSEECRKDIFKNFYTLCDIQLQREFIVRYVKQVPKKSSTTARTDSRRQNTNFCFLPLQGNPVKVCRKFFISTLSISEKTIRTALEKLQDTGVIQKDRRGGRCKAAALRDEANRNVIQDHINRFQRVESHYCRKDSTREYLHSDLTLKKMYTMFVNEVGPNSEKPCFTTYRTVFKGMNLSFHRPKKDQCSLCKTYHEGSSETKLKMQGIFDEHTKSKNAVRDIKNSSKNAAQINHNLACLCFDLQQVIYLPISNDGSIFYKRRFAVYNLTFYDIASRDCYCFTWNECDSGRGASEISTALFKTLLKYDEKEVNSADLFADGCGGQNRNSIVAAILLYIVWQSKHLREISLRFFTSSHGQSEGDSAHSAISYAIKKAGEMFVPSQLLPVFRLARRANPYEVCSLGVNDFLDVKKFSEGLRLRSIRIDDEGNTFKWTDMVEFKVKKSDNAKIFFKTSHLDQNYRSLTLKRQHALALTKGLDILNKGPRPISMAKYNDLLTLCSGNTPVIKLPEHVHFYRSLPHTTE